VGDDGVESAGGFVFEVSILTPLASFAPQEARVITQKADTTNDICFMEHVLTLIKIHNYLNKAKRLQQFIKTSWCGSWQHEMSKKINIPQRWSLRNVIVKNV
jgi:hypothetical protein